MRNVYIFLCSLALFVGACTPKPLDIEVDPAEPKMVVASQVIPNELMIVSLTHSFSALAIDAGEDSVTQDFLDDIFVDGAVVTIAYKDQMDTLLGLGNGVYASLNTPQYVNEIYELHAYNPKKDEHVRAAAEMLEHVPFDTIYPSVEITSTDTVTDFTYAFTDPPGENFYMVNIYTRFESQGVGFDVNTYFNRGNNLLVHTELISDKQFSSTEISGVITPEVIQPDDSVVVAISNISKEYFDYLGIRIRSQNWWSEITQEPVTYPTNVKNGYGFFNTHYPDVEYFYLPEYQ